MASAKQKKPKTGGLLAGYEKKPRAPVDTGDKRIAWRLGMIDFDGPWCWTKLATAKKIEVYRKLAEYERKTWGEFGGRGGNKNIPVDSLIPEAQQRLTRLRLDDVDGALWELHLAGLERVWAVRQGDILHFLWWDPDHKICPSTKTGN